VGGGGCGGVCAGMSRARACVSTLAAYAEKLVATPSGRRRRSSKRVTPWKLTFSVTMLMLLRPAACAAARRRPRQRAAERPQPRTWSGSLAAP